MVRKRKGWDILHISLDTNIRDTGSTFQMKTFNGSYVIGKKTGSIISVGANPKLTLMFINHKRPCYVEVPIFV